MSLPSCSAGPDRATDWPRRIWLSVTPCAQARLEAAHAARRRSSRFMKRPRWFVVPFLFFRGMILALAEELPHLVHEALGARVVARAVLLVDLLQLAQDVLLAVGEAHRRLHHHLAEEVAGVGRAHALDALAAQAEHLAALGLGRNLDLGRAVERRDFDLA